MQKIKAELSVFPLGEIVIEVGTVSELVENLKEIKDRSAEIQSLLGVEFNPEYEIGFRKSEGDASTTSTRDADTEDKPVEATEKPTSEVPAESPTTEGKEPTADDVRKVLARLPKERLREVTGPFVPDGKRPSLSSVPKERYAELIEAAQKVLGEE